MLLFHAQKSLRYNYEARNDLNRSILFPLFTNFPSIDIFSLCIYREVWRHVTMVAKFLDLCFSFLSWQRRPFVLSNDRRKVIWQPFFFLECKHAQTEVVQVNFSFLFSLPYLHDQGLLRSRKFATMVTWHNDFFFLFRPVLKEICLLNVFPKLKVYICRWNCLFVPDVDECTASEQLCDLNANCINTHGSYYCSCFSGFSGDGNTCIGKENERFLKEIHFIC